MDIFRGRPARPPSLPTPKSLLGRQRRAHPRRRHAEELGRSQRDRKACSKLRPRDPTYPQLLGGTLGKGSYPSS